MLDPRSRFELMDRQALSHTLNEYVDNRTQELISMADTAMITLEVQRPATSVAAIGGSILAPEPTEEPAFNQEELRKYETSGKNIDIKQRILSHVRFFSFKEFKSALNALVDKFNSEFKENKDPYVVLWDMERQSSKHWVHSLISNKLVRPPQLATYFVNG